MNSSVTPRQIAKTITLIADSNITSAQYQGLLESGRFTELLWEFIPRPPPPIPTIIPVDFPRDYNRTLRQMLNACNFDVVSDFSEEKYPHDARPDEREFVLVCFNCPVGDHEYPADSQLLQELDKLGLVPEGPFELLALVAYSPELLLGEDEEVPGPQIVARGQMQRPDDSRFAFPYVTQSHEGCCISSWYWNKWFSVRDSWPDSMHFLCSRKPVKSK